MKKILNKINRGVKKMLNIPMEFLKEIKNDKELRVMLGILSISFGSALVLSAYINVPQ